MLLYVRLACVSVTSNSPESQATKLFGRLFSTVFGRVFGKADGQRTTFETRWPNDIPNRTYVDGNADPIRFDGPRRPPLA